MKGMFFVFPGTRFAKHIMQSGAAVAFLVVKILFPILMAT